MASAQGVVIYSIVLLFIHPYLMITSVVLGILFIGHRTMLAQEREQHQRTLGQKPLDI
ncbi:hypothetical protein AAHH67_27375 [Niallia circulans]